MKKLHLIRHAKSSWADDSLADIDRPLNHRGVKSCQIMAAQMVKAGCSFEHVFCSPAVRSQSTIEQLTQQLTNSRTQPQTKGQIKWQVDQALYTFEMSALLKWCQALNNSLSEVVVVGHNSALTDLINRVGDQPIENLPTCGYAQLALESDSWQALSADSARLLSFLKPKMFL